jgi:UDP-N-acetyl-D-mannosaminuronic acid transferase (WecB/TagA/CpsF family)
VLGDKIKNRTNVLGVGVSALDMDAAVATLLEARAKGQSGYVCVTGVHGVIESQRDPELKQIHNRSFLTVPDGMPTVWMGREQGFTKMGRVYGPDLMLRLMEATASNQRTEVGGQRSEDGGRKSEVGGRKSEVGGQRSEDGGRKSEDGGRKSDNELDSSKLTSDLRLPISEKMSFTHFLYGATEETLKQLKSNLEERFPGVQIVGTYAPPFRPLNETEEEELRQIVADCKPDFFWVGLSTPKQEKFMAAHCLGNACHEFKRTEVGGRRTEDRGQRSEDRGQRSEVRG